MDKAFSENGSEPFPELSLEEIEARIEFLKDAQLANKVTKTGALSASAVTPDDFVRAKLHWGIYLGDVQNIGLDLELKSLEKLKEKYDTAGS